MKFINDLLWARNNRLSREEFLSRRLVLRSKPQFLIIDPTSRCNARCIMCYQSFRPASEHGGDLPLSVFHRIKPVLPNASHINLFSTGEPTLAEKIVFFLKEIQKGSYSRAPIYLGTNGKSLSTDILDCVRQPQMFLQFSVDGGTKEIFESIRRGISFEELCQTLEQVNDLKRGGKYPSLSFSSTISKRNIHDIGAIFALAKRFDVEQVIFYEEDPEVSEEETYLIDETDRPCFEAQRPFIESTGIRYFNGLIFRGPNAQRISASPENGTQERLDCAAPWKVFHLHADGSVRTCCTLKASMGNLRKASFEEVWNGTEYIRLRQAFIEQRGIPSPCLQCTDPLRTWGKA